MSPKLKPWLLLVGIFIVGVVTGSALTIGLGPRFVHPQQLHLPEPRDMNRHLMAYLTKRLNLTADQQTKIQPIMAEATTQLQSRHHEEMERDSQIFKAADDQISALLTPEQKVELQKMESEREKLFSGHMRPWGPPRDGTDGAHHHGGPGDGGMPPPPTAPTNAPPPGQGAKQ